LTTIKLKFTRLGRREARLIRKEKELEAERKALEMERWAAKEATKRAERVSLQYEVKRRWAEYDRRKDPKIKEEIGRIIQEAHEEGIELVSP